MPNCCSKILAATATLIGFASSEAVAQTLPPLPTPPNDVNRRIRESEDSLAGDDIGAAVDALQRIIDLEEDYFDPRAPGQRSAVASPAASPASSGSPRCRARPVTIPDRPMTDPTERSIPPVMIAKV